MSESTIGRVTPALRWTKDPPIRDGSYWLGAYHLSPIVVEVHHYGDEGQAIIFWSGISRPEEMAEFIRRHDDVRWAGPLTTPEE